jgi:hypothetical protein
MPGDALIIVLQVLPGHTNSRPGEADSATATTPPSAPSSLGF